MDKTQRAIAPAPIAENFVMRMVRHRMTLGLMALEGHSKMFRRWFWMRLYQHLAGREVPKWGFMNYGFAADRAVSPEPLSLRPEDEPDRYFIQLYHRVAAVVNVEGLDVLEIGCGRGGGASYIKRYLRPKSMRAVDFSPKAIKYCRRAYDVPGLTYAVDNAEGLSSETAAFDVVVNVESSHCYGSMQSFLSEVRRVLRPGGYLLHADVGLPQDAEAFRKELQQAGLTMLDEQDITSNVLRAVQLDNDRKLALIDAHMPRWFRKQFQQLAGVEGSKINNLLRRGDIVYTCRKIQSL